MPPIRTQAEYAVQEQRNKLASSYQSLLSEFASPDLSTVGNYSLGRLIGKGSFGKVYLATHTLTNASKVVLKSANKDDANLAREIHHHRQFLHPHIARLYEVIVTENLVWLALEWCPGDELYNHLLKHGRMDVGKVQKIFTQLVGAVSYVHSKSCVHRDLKLENILLDKNENVKLVDFGFTREYTGPTSYLQTWCGTICYSAPEMLRGEKYAGEKVDVWSLGIILYALLCGELPFDEDDDENATKLLILNDEPKYPAYIAEPALDLLKKLLSKRPILRPSLGDILKDSWLNEYAPQQQEILKLQQPPAFSTQVEKDTLERMRSAGVDIDVVIEHVLGQRCDALAGWWALLIEKEQRKEKRRERRRKEREAEAKSIRRLSAASSRLLAQSALGGIYEGEEHLMSESPRSRGRRATRPSGGSIVQATDLPEVRETLTPTPERQRPPDLLPDPTKEASRSRSRPPLPPKDPSAASVRRPRNATRRSGSMLRHSTPNPDLLSPTYVPPVQRKRKTFYQQPLKDQLAWVKHWFKENAKRAKSPGDGAGKKDALPTLSVSDKDGHVADIFRDLRRTTTGPLQHQRAADAGSRPGLQTRATLPARPRINTMSSTDSRPSQQGKRTSLSPHTLTPHSSYRRSSAGLRGRKSTSPSVSSIRSTYQGHHHTQSKASSNSDGSIASPSGLSSTSGSRLGRSPHASVKILPATPTNGSFPSGIRVSRRPPPSGLGTLPSFAEPSRGIFGAVGPGSPSLPVFARRKRSVFKGPMAGSTSGFGRAGGSGSRSGSVPGRKSIAGITEEDEEAEEEDVEDDEMEEVDHFGPELTLPQHHAEDRAEDELGNESTSPISPLTRPSTALTAQALAKMAEEDEDKGGL